MRLLVAFVLLEPMHCLSHLWHSFEFSHCYLEVILKLWIGNKYDYSIYLTKLLRIWHNTYKANIIFSYPFKLRQLIARSSSAPIPIINAPHSSFFSDQKPPWELSFWIIVIPTKWNDKVRIENIYQSIWDYILMIMNR